MSSPKIPTPGGHVYHDFQISGNAHVHLGNSVGQDTESTSAKRKRNKEILALISEIDVEFDHHQVRTTLGRRYGSSGQWFRPKYDEWVASLDNPIFWLAGSVGTGKSSLVSNIIEWHSEEIKSQEKKRLVFFYCSNKNGPKSTPLEIFRSFVAQLAGAENHLSISPLIMEKYKSDTRLSFNIEECADLLINLINEYHQTTFIVDALDECDDPHLLLLRLKFLWKHVSKTKKSIKFFLSGRNQIEVFFHFPNCEKLELENLKHLTIEDMKNYIQSQVKERDQEELCSGLRLLKGKYPELEDRLIDVLVKRSQGMFQWVELQLDLFLGPQSRLNLKEDMTRKLESLESSEKSQKFRMLDSVYGDIYNNNTEEDSHSRSIAARALKWMMYAQRPLKMIELAEAASANDDDIHNDGIEDEFTAEGLRICSNFIIPNQSGFAQFPHVSVREYLERREINGTKEYSAEQAHIQIAVTCLTYLNNSDNPIIIPNQYEFEYEYCFREYSIMFWIVHVAAIAIENRSRLLHNLYIRFLSTNEKDRSIINWLHMLSDLNPNLKYFDGSLYSKHKQAISKRLDPLFAACIWGLIDMIPASSLTISNLEILNDFNMSSLALACRYGHLRIVSLLLKKGAKVNACVNEKTSALNEACYYGHEDVVQLLLNNAAEVNAPGRYSGNALKAACFNGHESVIRLLLNKGAKINTQGGYRGNALNTACFNGHESVVRLLLNKGAEINAQDEYHGTALQAACYHGHESVVRLLLNKGAKINAQGGYHGNALRVAQKNRHKTTVQLLFDIGAFDR